MTEGWQTCKWMDGASGEREREWVQKEIRRERWTLLENPAKTSCWNRHFKSKSASIFIFRHHQFQIYLHINITLRQNELWAVNLHINQMVFFRIRIWFCSHIRLCSPFTFIHTRVNVRPETIKVQLFFFFIQDHNANDQKSGYVEICWSKLNIWSRWLVGRGFDLVHHLGQAV